MLPPGRWPGMNPPGVPVTTGELPGRVPGMNPPRPPVPEPTDPGRTQPVPGLSHARTTELAACPGRPGATEHGFSGSYLQFEVYSNILIW